MNVGLNGLKLCICVTGTTGSGKSTLTKKLGSMGWHTIHTGDVFRSRGMTLAGQQDPVAPENGDQLIHDHIMATLERFSYDHVKTNAGPCLVVVETVPRKLSQITWIKEMRDSGWVVVLVGMDARPEIRKSRVQSRDVMEPDRLDGDMKKLGVENNWNFWDRFPDEVLAEMKILDTSKWHYSCTDKVVVHSIASSVKLMMIMAENYYQVRRGTSGDSVTVAKDMIDRTIDELGELMETVGSGSYTNTVEELVDCMWFLLMTVLKLGIDPTALVNAFIHKYNVNMDRGEKGHKAHLTTGEA